MKFKLEGKEKVGMGEMAIKINKVQKGVKK